MIVKKKNTITGYVKKSQFPKKPDIRARFKERLEAFGLAAGNGEGFNAKGSPSYRVEAVVSDVLQEIIANEPDTAEYEELEQPVSIKPVKKEKETYIEVTIPSFASRTNRISLSRRDLQDDENSSLTLKEVSMDVEEIIEEKPTVTPKEDRRNKHIQNELIPFSDQNTLGTEKITNEDTLPDSPGLIRSNSRINGQSTVPQRKRAQFVMSEKADRLRTRSGNRNVHNVVNSKIADKNKAESILELARSILSSTDPKKTLKTLQEFKINNLKMSDKQDGRNKPHRNENGDYESELEAISLRKRREPLSKVDGNETNFSAFDPEVADILAQKAAHLKNALKASKEGGQATITVAQQAKLLHSLLKFLGTYHGIRMPELIEMLDESRGLNLELLRLRLCNHTVVQKVG